MQKYVKPTLEDVARLNPNKIIRPSPPSVKGIVGGQETTAPISPSPPYKGLILALGGLAAAVFGFGRLLYLVDHNRHMALPEHIRPYDINKDGFLDREEIINYDSRK